jgi:hypothetical protein
VRILYGRPLSPSSIMNQLGVQQPFAQGNVAES